MSTETQKVDVLTVSCAEPHKFDAADARRKFPELTVNLRTDLIDACNALRMAELSASKARGDRRHTYKRARVALELQLKALARIGGDA